jgi:hypothetical protein
VLWRKDIIVLLGNDTTIKSSSAYGYKEWEYNKNLVAADNTPAPAESGLQVNLKLRLFSIKSAFCHFGFLSLLFILFL